MKAKKTNRLQKYEIAKLYSLINAATQKTDPEYLSFSRIQCGEVFKYPTNEQEADIFVKDRIRLLLFQDMRNLLNQMGEILFTEHDILA